MGLESGPLNTEYIILTFRTHLNTGEQACWLKTVFGTCKDRRRELAIKKKEQRARTHLQVGDGGWGGGKRGILGRRPWAADGGSLRKFVTA